jgi:hypothetical protein
LHIRRDELLDRRDEMLFRRHEWLFPVDEWFILSSRWFFCSGEWFFCFDRLLFCSDRQPNRVDRFLFRPRRSRAPTGKRSFERRVSAFLRFETSSRLKQGEPCHDHHQEDHHASFDRRAQAAAHGARAVRGVEQAGLPFSETPG